MLEAIVGATCSKHTEILMPRKISWEKFTRRLNPFHKRFNADQTIRDNSESVRTLLRAIEKQDQRCAILMMAAVREMLFKNKYTMLYAFHQTLINEPPSSYFKCIKERESSVMIDGFLLSSKRQDLN
jgi:hypothetical protein